MAITVSGSRFFQKNGTEANWNKVTDFIPGKGEILIYNPDENHAYPRIKVGNGIDLPKDLPFAMGGGSGGEIDPDNIVAAKLKHKLTFGSDQDYVFDGSEDVTVPVYQGSYEIDPN